MSRYLRQVCRMIVRGEARNNTKRKVEVEHMEHPVKSNGGLIPVFAGEIGGVACNVCDARALHAFLGSKRQFANWIKQRIKKYGFVEDEDFSCLTNLFSSNNQGLSNFVAGDNRLDYHLTIDTAKELAMVESNDKGRQARRYFSELIQTSLENKTMSHEQEKILHNQVVVIGETTIHQDADGRYCINDLHKAAGGDDKNRPTFWMRSDQAKELIGELEAENQNSSVQIRTVNKINQLAL